MKKILLTTAAVLSMGTAASADPGGYVVPMLITEIAGQTLPFQLTHLKHQVDEEVCPADTTCFSFQGTVFNSGTTTENLTVANNLVKLAIVNESYDPETLVDYFDNDLPNNVEDFNEEFESQEKTGTIFVAVPGNQINGKNGAQHGGITFFNFASVETNNIKGNWYLWNDTLYASPGAAAVAQVNAAANFMDGVVDPDYLNSPYWTEIADGLTPEENATMDLNNILFEGAEYALTNDMASEMVDLSPNAASDGMANKVKPSASLSSEYIFQQVVNEYSALQLRGKVAEEVLQLSKDVFVKGYDNGFEDGYDQGYNDGYTDGFTDGWNARDAQG